MQATQQPRLQNDRIVYFVIFTRIRVLTDSLGGPSVGISGQIEPCQSRW